MKMKTWTIRNKILLSILLVTASAAGIITIVFNMGSLDVIEKNYSEELLQKEEFIIDSLDTELTRSYTIGTGAACDESFVEKSEAYSLTEDESNLTDIASKLREYASFSGSISSMYYYMTEEDVLITSREYPVYRKDASRSLSSIVSAYGNEDISAPVLLRDVGDMNSYTLSYIIPVKTDSGKIRGYMFMNMDCDLLYYDYIADAVSDITEEAVILLGDRVAASKGGDNVGDRYSGYEQNSKWLEAKKAAGSDGDYVYVCCSGNFSGCSIFVKVSQNEIVADMTNLWGYMIVIMLAVILAAIVAAMYVSDRICRPVGELTEAMTAAAEGDLQVRAEVESRDEIGELADDFNYMMDQMNQLIGQLVEEEKKKKDAELEALQYQITPHFMYNTLNSIRSAALIKGEKELAGVIGDFVQLLQASVSKKGKMYSLTEEIEMLKKYISVQEFRFGSSIDAEYDITDEAGACIVPRLILQPLVENAIIHGMDMKSGGRLTISAEYSDGRLCMKVSDNGRGMSPEEIDQLLSSRERKTRGLTAVGVPNIIDRLRIYYGDEGTLAYESGDEGTTAVIVMPADKVTVEFIDK